jgi:exosortase A
MAEPSHQASGTISVARYCWVLLYAVAVVLLYRDTAWSMVSIWQRSETYAHGYLIVPISLWLIWTKRSVLAAQAMKPVWWVSLLLVPGGIGWLLAHLADVQVIQQLALVGILVVGIWAIVGHSFARIIAFPLGFLFLAVPMGEDLVPPMMEFTATSTVWLIKLTGIPVYREGLYFTLPSGNWSVVEACSGVRYIIASLTLGLLYAHLTYRSLGRQLLFVLASLVVPVFANTARAYIIVMLGHLSGMTIATGVDHLIYGWVFFGLVMLLLFWIGSFWREGEQVAGNESLVAASLNSQPAPPVGRFLAAWLVTLILAGFWPLFGQAIDHTVATDTNVTLQLPPAAGDWTPEVDLPWTWQPVEAGQDAQLIAAYRRGDDHVVLYLQQYLQQRQGAELVSGKPGQFVDEKETWRIVARGKKRALLGTSEVTIDQLRLSDGPTQLQLWNWYRIGDRYTANPYVAKWYEASRAITFGRRDAARIIVATNVASQADTKELLQAFVSGHLPGIESALDSAGRADQ